MRVRGLRALARSATMIGLVIGLVITGMSAPASASASASASVVVGGGGGAGDSGGVIPAGRLADDPIAHDPTIMKAGRYYYSFITGDIATRTYLPMRRSTDLLHWEFLGTVFTTPPAWVVQELGVTPGDFWAPDINYFDGEYHLYYAASSFGTNNSVIGLATNPTLDPDDPDYGWVDHGMVFRSRSTTDDFNAIDADIVFDPQGQPWMSFGSFWDGIKMRKLDRRTGMLSTTDRTLYPLASRGGASIEGPSIVRRGGFYYLFVSLDFCCRGVDADYRLVVGRSTGLTGPYLDRDGVALLAGGGTDLLRGYNEFRGTGGGDVFSDARGDWFAHHYNDTAAGGVPKLSVRRISWAGGWPSFGDPVSGSSRVGHGPAYFTVVNRASGAAMDNPTCGYEGADIRLAVVETGDTCQQWRPEERGGGQVSLLNRFSNKVAEVAACVNTDAARVAQWGWLANDCQRFRLLSTDSGWSRIENRLAGRVLEAAGCGGVGAPIRTFTWLGNDCQQFRLDPVGDVLLADAAGRRVLDAPGCGSHRVTVAPRRAGACQLWRFVHTGEGHFRIVSARTGKALTVSRGGLVLGDPRTAAQWRIEAQADGGYRLVTRGSARVAEPSRPDSTVTRDGRAVTLAGRRAGTAAPDGSTAQRLLLLVP